MIHGALLARFDVAQVTLYAFWIFFAGLIWYLRQEDHREGYPLVADYPASEQLSSPSLPVPKHFLTADDTVISVPRNETAEPVPGERVQGFAGAPFEPIGDPMLVGIGPGAWANRHDVPDLAYDDGKPKIVPLRAAPAYYLAEEDTDPRGFSVVGCDGLVAGTVVDAWIDRSEFILRYLEVETTAELGARRVLLPTAFADIRARMETIKVASITAAHFATVPATKLPETVTFLEEDRICAYYAGGLFYAVPGRLEPVL